MSRRKHRNYGLDLVKILACILVLCLHSLVPTSIVVKSSLVNLSVYYAGTVAIPIFFMASSYFVLNKRTISYLYVMKRIGEILFIIIGWVLLYSIAYLCVKHKFIFFEELKGTAFLGIPHQHFYHFWFFWALIMMLLLSPLLWYLLQKSFFGYLILTAIVTLICISIDISMHFGNSSNVHDIPQVFRLYLYVEYYLLGGLVGNIHFKKIKNFCKKNFVMISVVTVLLYIEVIIYSIWNKDIIHWAYAEANYGNALIIFTSVLILIIFSISSPHGKNIIEFIIPATMGIYMLHPFFIGKLMKIHILHSYPILMIPVLFILCLVIVEIALRIPLVNRFFKL